MVVRNNSCKVSDMKHILSRTIPQFYWAILSQPYREEKKRSRSECERLCSRIWSWRAKEMRVRENGSHDCPLYQNPDNRNRLWLPDWCTRLRDMYKVICAVWYPVDYDCYRVENFITTVYRLAPWYNILYKAIDIILYKLYQLKIKKIKKIADSKSCLTAFISMCCYQIWTIGKPIKMV